MDVLYVNAKTRIMMNQSINNAGREKEVSEELSALSIV